MIKVDKPMTVEQQNLFLDVLYATDRVEYEKKYYELTGGSEMSFEIDKLRRHEGFTDPNFSLGAERVTMHLGGKDHHGSKKKHGLDGEKTNSEAKPEKTFIGGKKLEGALSFADMSLAKVETHYETNVEALSSGWVEGHCLYVIGIPMKNDKIKNHLVESFRQKVKNGVRKVLRFSRTQYSDADLKLYWIHPDFENYKSCMVKPQYDLVKSLQNNQ